MKTVYEVASIVQKIIVTLLGVFTIHQAVYICVGLFATKRFRPASRQHKYAIMIAARNEEAVIGNLLESINGQDYPRELLTVFVVADNCSDATAKIARSHGAVCYERFNKRECTKGFALQFLMEQIQKDYGIASFEGYFIFDADNLLAQDYVSRMNDAFDEGKKIITSYRNTKNFDENWVSSTYALHWLRSIRFNHRARSVFGLATNIQGTGYLFANELVKDGWNYTSLTEDRAFTADAVIKGYEITYNDAAMFYDEQPTSLKIAWRQRTRWNKGHLLAFKELGWSLIKNIFKAKTFRQKFASYDTLTQLMPMPVISTAVWLIVSIILYSVLSFQIGGMKAVLLGIGTAAWLRLLSNLRTDAVNILTAVYVFIAEHKKIKPMPFYKKILFCITWPVFDIFYRFTMYAALFMKVKWKPIPHTSKVKIEDLKMTSTVECSRIQ